MNRDLSNFRVDYRQSQLLEVNLPNRPFVLFNLWLGQAIQNEDIAEPNTMNLATVNHRGFPRSRTVLLKSCDIEGFIFYSNYDSEKGKQMDENPNVALTFLWKEMHRQVRIEGVVEKISREDSLRYFRARPRDSQLGALSSDQSAPLKSRDILEDRYRELEAKYTDQEIPMPENWGGYKVRPSRYEFWQGRASRLHDRIVYTNIEDQVWSIHRLYP